MNRTDKVTALTAFFDGQTAKVKQLGAAKRSRRMEDMTDAELIAIIEQGTGHPCPDYAAMSDEELEAIINRAKA